MNAKDIFRTVMSTLSDRSKSIGVKMFVAAAKEISAEAVAEVVAWLADTFPPEVLQEALARAQRKRNERAVRDEGTKR